MAIASYHVFSDNDLNQMSNMQGEQKRGQFLGSTLKSTGNTFLVVMELYVYNQIYLLNS